MNAVHDLTAFGESRPNIKPLSQPFSIVSFPLSPTSRELQQHVSQFEWRPVDPHLVFSGNICCLDHNRGSTDRLCNKARYVDCEYYPNNIQQMRHVNISISLPVGYVESIDEESKRYGLKRSEFVRVLFDAYLSVKARMVMNEQREPDIAPKTNLEDFFPDVLPHRKAEAHEWLHDYLRLVIRILKESKERKETTGTVDRDSVY
jgi:hypothetical protein